MEKQPISSKQSSEGQRKISQDLSSALEKFNSRFLGHNSREDILDEISPIPDITSTGRVIKSKPLRPGIMNKPLHVPEIPPLKPVTEVDQPELIPDGQGGWKRKEEE